MFALLPAPCSLLPAPSNNLSLTQLNTAL
ncbi:hypothetical protein LYNGBM3L_73530 [Moorena producens 3L]|uniref:Uncharacterized protein n=1 Tax=Moorena producens 3L TaxID=489825 RepID=F4Y3X0_9CYAN|nr:hypothetical protein LYNGBM3L_73530 [Moorena producens 3L]